MCLDDLLGRVRIDKRSLDIPDLVGPPFSQNRGKPTCECSGHGRQGFGGGCVIQLPKLDLGELRIVLASGVGCKEQRGSQQPVAGLGEARTRLDLTGLVGVPESCR